jgi:hypothetical protein
MIVGCYTLDLYCELETEDHEYKEFPHEYTDEYGSKCRSDARKSGWILRRDGTAICPKCNQKRKIIKLVSDMQNDAEWSARVHERNRTQRREDEDEAH